MKVWGGNIWNHKEIKIFESKTLVNLQEKVEKDQELKLNEILLQHEELELRKKEIENSKQQHNQMFEHWQTQNSQLFLLLASKI